MIPLQYHQVLLGSVGPEFSRATFFLAPKINRTGQVKIIPSTKINSIIFVRPSKYKMFQLFIFSCRCLLVPKLSPIPQVKNSSPPNGWQNHDTSVASSADRSCWPKKAKRHRKGAVREAWKTHDPRITPRIRSVLIFL